MNLLRLNDGTEIPVSQCAIVRDMLMITFADGMSVTDAILYFADESKLDRITFTYDGKEALYEGYTKIIRAGVDVYTGQTEIVLLKEE